MFWIGDARDGLIEEKAQQDDFSSHNLINMDTLSPSLLQCTGMRGNAVLKRPIKI